MPPAFVSPETRRDDPRLHILYVEDNAANRLLMQHVMRRRSDVILTLAEDGPHGLRSAHAQAPDLVLLDLGLPGMDGLEVLQRLRADPATATLAVVVLSAHCAPEHMAALFAAGADGYLTKPVDLVALGGVVDAAIAARPFEVDARVDAG